MIFHFQSSYSTLSWEKPLEKQKLKASKAGHKQRPSNTQYFYNVKILRKLCFALLLNPLVANYETRLAVINLLLLYMSTIIVKSN